MKRIFVYIISLSIALQWIPAAGQQTDLPIDTADVTLKIRTALEISGPLLYFTDKNILNLEANVTADLNEKYSLFLGGGYSDYSYSQYNYSFTANGVFFKAGADRNLLRPEMAEGTYWAGAGIHYGLSRFSAETPALRHDNYWGSVPTSVPKDNYWSHFIEVSGGFKAELFRNFSIGWLINIRKMIYTGASGNLRPIYFPGYGPGGSTFAYSINYFISYNIPYKKIKVLIYPEPPEEPDDEDTGQAGTTPQVGKQGIGR